MILILLLFYFYYALVVFYVSAGLFYFSVHSARMSLGLFQSDRLAHVGTKSTELLIQNLPNTDACSGS